MLENMGFSTLGGDGEASTYRSLSGKRHDNQRCYELNFKVFYDSIDNDISLVMRHYGIGDGPACVQYRLCDDDFQHLRRVLADKVNCMFKALHGKTDKDFMDMCL